MNCQNFLNSLHEYVEDSLATARRDAMNAHHTECADCRQLLEQEQARVQLLTPGFRHAVQHLTLPSDFHQRLLPALHQDSATPVVQIPEARQSTWRHLLWPAAMAACALFMSFHSIRLLPGAAAEKRVQVEPATATVPEISIAYSVRLPAWSFRREGNLVVDTLSYEIVVASGSFPAGGRLSVPEKQSTKTPL